MTEELLKELKAITPEEQRILDGSGEIDRDIYMSNEQNVIDAKKLLDEGKLIRVRPHTRFIHFPRHIHNFIEVIYMCTGTTHHVVNGKDVVLKPGELLFLNQSATQEIYPAGENDIAVNFFILPEFFEYGLTMISEEENQLRDFIIGCLRNEKEAPGYLHFKVADILPVQNLVENLIWSLWHKLPNRRSINQATMGILFLQLMNCMDRLETDTKVESGLIFSVLSYIDNHYRDGELTELAEVLHYDFHWLSKEIKKRTGKTYTELVQIKRLTQAAYLLRNTNKSVTDVALEVGYDNISYFYRIFQNRYGITPRQYRKDGE